MWGHPVVSTCLTLSLSYPPGASKPIGWCHFLAFRTQSLGLWLSHPSSFQERRPLLLPTPKLSTAPRTCLQESSCKGQPAPRPLSTQHLHAHTLQPPHLFMPRCCLWFCPMSLCLGPAACPVCLESPPNRPPPSLNRGVTSSGAV